MEISSPYKTEETSWKAVYIIGGVAALLAVFIFRRNLGAELALMKNSSFLHGLPDLTAVTAQDWFHLFQANRLVALTMLEAFDIVEYFLVGLMFIALYGALRRATQSLTMVATVLGLMGITVYFASNHAFAMLSLSERYAAATSDAQRAGFLVAGEALLASYNPSAIYQGAGIYLSLLFVLLAGLVYSIIMLRSKVFGKGTAIIGIVYNSIGLCYFLTLAFVPALYWVPIPISAPFRVIWYFLIALQLFKLARK